MRHEAFEQELAAVLEVDSATLLPEFKLEQSAYWDSLSIVSTLALVRRHFDVGIAGDRLEKCVTLQDIYDYVHQVKGAV
jgi:acyl carrier protein